MRDRVQAARIVRVAFLVALLLALVETTTGTLHRLYAQSAGATLTVLRGSAAVLRADGTPLSPAANGLTLGVGDQVATLSSASALVTFFDGSEVELGADTTIIIREMSQSGSTNRITLESVVGTTLHRVVTLTDSNSSYRVEAGGTVALVRGTVFAHRREATGDTTVAVAEGTVEFPHEGTSIRRGDKRTETSRGDIVDTTFDPTTPLINTVAIPAAVGNPTGTNNPGIATGSFSAPQQQSVQQRDEAESKEPPPSSSTAPGHTILVSPASAGATRLDVASSDGFQVGDTIVVGSGPSAETHVVTGFGSILIDPPLGHDFGTGTSVDLANTGSPPPTLDKGGGSAPTDTPTIATTLTITPTPRATATDAPTAGPGTPTGTPTATRTPTPTSTATRTPTPTSTGPSNQPGTLTGVVRNATSGAPIAGASVDVIGSIAPVTTGSDGRFTITGVAPGRQSIETTAAQFVTDTRTVDVVEGTNAELSIALTPVRTLGEVTIVLTWGSQPRDLDGHLSGPASGSGRFHLYWADRTSPPVSYASQDVDDTTSFGPETITIRRDPSTNQFVPGEYRYWVHNYSHGHGGESQTYAGSAARVVVNQGLNQLAEYRVSDATGPQSQDIWFVVRITIDTAGNVTLTPVQQLQTGSDATIL